MMAPPDAGDPAYARIPTACLAQGPWAGPCFPLIIAKLNRFKIAEHDLNDRPPEIAMPKNPVDACCQLLDALLALVLALMAMLVFGNVVLRYAFNTGITMSEEVSRWLFVWLVFLGSIVALKEGRHLGSDMLVSRLPARGRKICLVLGHGLMLYISWLIFSGSLEQTRINWDVAAPVTGASVGIFYAAGIVFALACALLLLRGLWQAAAATATASEPARVQESEESAAWQKRPSPCSGERTQCRHGAHPRPGSKP